MTDDKIAPHKVTKPIQLLAAWLVGLCIVNGTFLASAATISTLWLQAVLVVAAVLNVPVFIVAIFLLQTKYRPEMQEDEFYSKYLDRKTDQYINLSPEAIDSARLGRLESELLALTNAVTSPTSDQSKDAREKARDRGLAFPLGIGINDHLPWFNELRASLREEGFPVTDIFGSVNKTEPPDKFVITIGSQLIGTPLRSEAVLDLLTLLLVYDFNGIEIDDTRTQPEPNDVYIGAYEMKYVPITAEFRRLVNERADLIDLEHFYRSHRGE